VGGLRDTRYNPVLQSRNDFPATAYADAQGDWIVVRDIDGDVIQVNDRGDPNYKAPF
jgi:hypothetical protein